LGPAAVIPVMKASVAVRAALASLLLIGVTGCAQAADEPGQSPGGDALTFPSGDTVALRVAHSGGFVPVSLLASRIPMVTVYADGRVITEGAQIMIYPAPALPSIEERRIAVADVLTLVGRAQQAGVGSGVDLGQPNVTDMPDTVFTVYTATGEQKTSAYALTEEISTTGLSPEQIEARSKLLGLLKELTDLEATLGAGKVSAGEQYQPVTVAGIASTWNPPSAADGLQPSKEIAWPGPALPGKQFSEGLDLGCVAVTGDQVSKVMAAAATANVATPWASEGKLWHVSIRPLLPGEADCDALRW
jgi:hypothetical protein